jgi:hypothetical protein
MWALASALPILKGLDKQRPSKILGILNRTQAGKGIPTRTLCQKNQGTVNIKQKPVKMGDRTTLRALSPERTPLQNGINEVPLAKGA